MEGQPTVRAIATEANGATLMDSRIAESTSLSFRIASRFHFPPTSLNALSHSSRKASMYPRDGSEVIRLDMRLCKVKVVLCRDTLLVMRSLSEMRLADSCLSSSREMASSIIS